MLKTIVMVTMLSSNLAVTEKAYEDYLGYEVVEQGVIDESLAQSWGAEKTAGKEYMLMQPESGADVYLRFIESNHQGDADSAYQAMKQVGWNATELLVKDPDALQQTFQQEGSPFRVVGPPQFLTDQQNIRAMQVLGPDNELLYLSHIADPSKMRFDLGQATSFVDRVFIMVLGTKTLAETKAFFDQQFQQPVYGPFDYRIGVLSKAYGLPEDTLHPLSLAPLQGQFSIEIDQYPDAANEIIRAEGELPNGVALVSFYVDDIDAINKQAMTEPIMHKGLAYLGNRSVTLKSPSGALLELIEQQVSPKPAADSQ